MVDTGQTGDVADEFVQESWLQQISLLCDERFLSQHNLLGSSGVSAEQPPVDEASVPEVRILTLLSGKGEDLLDQLLGVVGLFRNNFTMEVRSCSCT